MEHGAAINTPTPFRSISVPKAPRPPAGRIVATYDYPDPDTGADYFQVVRLEPKDFRQRRPDGAGGWIWNMDGITRQPYRLAELRAADPTELVFIVEGEKDVDRLRSIGLVATCNPGGAEKWRDEYSAEFANRLVILPPDNDAPGRRHVDQVARSTYGIAASVKLLTLPGLPEKGDISDWLDAGGTKEKLLALVAATPEWEPPKATTTATPDVAALQARVADLEGRLNQALTENQTLKRERSAIMRGLANEAVKVQAPTGFAVINTITNGVAAGRARPDGSVRLDRATIGKRAGSGKEAAGAHMKVLAEGRVYNLVRENERVQKVDPQTGLISMVTAPIFYGSLLPGDNHIDAYERIAAFDLELPRRGGRRDPATCPHTTRQKRTTERCLDCGTTVAITTEPAEKRERHFDVHRDIADEGEDLSLSADGPDREHHFDVHTLPLKDAPEGFDHCLLCGDLTSAGRPYCAACAAVSIGDDSDEDSSVTFWTCEAEGCGWQVVSPETRCTSHEKQYKARLWAAGVTRPAVSS